MTTSTLVETGRDQPPLTLLYVPGDRPDRVVKAIDSDADVVIIDLEDAVTPAGKEMAREGLATAATSTHARPRIERWGLQVRVNAIGSPWHAGDISAVGMLPPRVGLRLPKCEDSGAVRGLAQVMGRRRLHLLIESAIGVELAWELARCDARIASIGLGEADLMADLGLTSEEGLTWARARIVNAAAAAGLNPPVMSVFPDVADADRLAQSCATGRALGFLGRAAIHPRQLPVIAQAFTPSAVEVSAAQELLTAADDAAQVAEREGRPAAGALALPDGRFVDEAVLRRARRVLAVAER